MLNLKAPSMLPPMPRTTLRLARLAVLSTMITSPAWAQSDPVVDKSGFTLFNPTPDKDLRGFNTDRPTKGFSPITVDAGRVQYETDIFSYTHSNVGGVSTRLYTFADPVLKLGLTDRVELQVQYTGYNIQNTSVPGTGVRLQDYRGSGDLLLRTKVNLFGNEGGPAVALIPYVKFPTAARGIGNGHTEGGVIAPISYPLPWQFTLLVVPEVDVLKNANDAGHHFNFTQLINLSHPIGTKLTAFAELYSTLGTDSRSPPIYTFDAALAYAVTPTLQLDIGSNIGLNRNAPNLQLYTGISQRF